MGTTACDMQMRSRYKTEDKPHSQSTSKNLARVGLIGLVEVVGLVWAMVGLSFGVESNLAATRLNVICLKMNIVALVRRVW